MDRAQRERFEHASGAAGDLTDVRLTLWPGGVDDLLARAGYYGDPVEWLLG